jgi:3-hydroxyanthranilate 3,4-dioxygenase
MASLIASLSPLNLSSWIESIRPTLQPPVCNRMLYAPPGCVLQLMVVGGPNQRGDFHVEDGEELFFQLEGDMVLRVEERGALRDVRIREGECLLLPGRVPHSPQRFAGTLGLVAERTRRPGEVDGLRWYTAGGAVLYEETFACTDLATQLAPVIARFKASEPARTGAPAPGAPASPLRLNAEVAVGEAVPAAPWAEAAGGGRGGAFSGPGAPAGREAREFCVDLLAGGGGGGGGAASAWAAAPVPLPHSELFVYVLRGAMRLRVEVAAGGGGAREFALSAQDTLIVPGGAALLAAAGCGPLAAQVTDLGADCVCLLLRVGGA